MGLELALAETDSSARSRAARQVALAHHQRELERLSRLEAEDEEREKDLYMGFSPRQLASLNAAEGRPSAEASGGTVASTMASVAGVAASVERLSQRRRGRGARQLPKTHSAAAAAGAAAVAATGCAIGAGVTSA